MTIHISHCNKIYHKVNVLQSQGLKEEQTEELLRRLHLTDFIRRCCSYEETTYRLIAQQRIKNLKLKIIFVFHLMKSIQTAMEAIGAANVIV